MGERFLKIEDILLAYMLIRIFEDRYEAIADLEACLQWSGAAA